MVYVEQSLFPRDNREVARVSFQEVLKVLENQKEFTQQVLRHDLTRKDRKVFEINNAIFKLKVLHRLAVENQK